MEAMKMDFEVILKDALGNIEGIQGVALVGLDGNSIASVIMDG